MRQKIMESIKISEQYSFEVNKSSVIGKDLLIEHYWESHPRFHFFKSVKRNATFLDVGAGDGGLSVWKEWKEPIRNDIRMYGIDFKDGTHKRNYEGWFTGNLETNSFPFPDVTFDVIYMSHLLEHINEPIQMLERLFKHQAEFGTVYVELPHENTVGFPKNDLFMFAGFQPCTTNFFDDNSHTKVYTEKSLLQLFESMGYSKLHSGVIHNPYLIDDLLSTAYYTQDQELTTYALWNALKWSRYIVFEKGVQS